MAPRVLVVTQSLSQIDEDVEVSASQCHSACQPAEQYGKAEQHLGEDLLDLVVHDDVAVDEEVEDLGACYMADVRLETHRVVVRGP